MVKVHLQPKTPEEKLIHWTILLTWLFYSLGALYLVAPALGWFLASMSLGRYVGLIDDGGHPHKGLPWDAKVWILASTTLFIALVIGHINFGLSNAQIMKSAMGWLKGWALIAVFISVGATLQIRPAIIYRASAILGAQTLLLTPILVGSVMAGLPAVLYVSPLEVIGGAGPDFFRVSLYIVGGEGDAGGARLGYYGPWAPATALIGSMSFIFALFERDTRWKLIGLLSATSVCILSQSRMSFVSIPLTCLLVALLSRLSRPLTHFLLMGVLLLAIPFTQQIQIAADDVATRFSSARANSSRVRSALQRIAVHRWSSEAPVFGHGMVERGPHLVEHMVIGSHHTWNGLLFVKGLVGLISLAVPFAVSAIVTIIKCQAGRTARASLGVLATLFVFSFGENLEILSYLFWPGLVIVGISMRCRLAGPLAGCWKAMRQNLHQ
jgi:hypothetical protein